MPKITILAQIAREIPRELVESIAKHYQADKYSKGLNTWVHLLTLLFMQLSQTYVIELITNNMEWSAGEVAELYRRRWDIESFFKNSSNTSILRAS